MSYTIDVNGYDNTPEWGTCKAPGCKEAAYPIWYTGGEPDEPDLLLCEAHIGARISELDTALRATQADYAAIRGLARRLFAEDSTDQDALALFRIVETVDHPGAPFTIRYNRAKAVVEAARTHDNGTIDDALYAYDAPLKEESNDHTTAT